MTAFQHTHPHPVNGYVWPRYSYKEQHHVIVRGGSFFEKAQFLSYWIGEYRLEDEALAKLESRSPHTIRQFC